MLSNCQSANLIISFRVQKALIVWGMALEMYKAVLFGI